MTSNEALGIVATAGKIVADSTEALMANDWAKFFELHEQAENALMYVQIRCLDAQVRHRIQQLLDVLKERREIAMKMLGSAAIGDA